MVTGPDFAGFPLGLAGSMGSVLVLAIGLGRPPRWEFGCAFTISYPQLFARLSVCLAAFRGNGVCLGAGCGIDGAAVLDTPLLQRLTTRF